MLFRKGLILVHRYLGIAISLLFVVWFASGITMIYTGGMPGLTPQVRLDRLVPLDIDEIRLTPAQAAEQAGFLVEPEQLTLLTVMDRPAYRFEGAFSLTVFADTGELLTELDPPAAVRIARRFMNQSDGGFRHVGVRTEADQWTIGEGPHMPLHKIVVGDAAGTELYVSEVLGEVSLVTTRRTRMLAWIGAIPHWLYFAPLRLNGGLWRQVILWTAGLGGGLALLGLVLGVIQTRFSVLFRSERRGRIIPYSGWMWWHHLAGLVFGLFALTWVFSGFLSMEPWGWASGGGIGAGMRGAFSGGSLNPGSFPPLEGSAWKELAGSAGIKEVEFVRIQGEPHYLLSQSLQSRTGFDRQEYESQSAGVLASGRVLVDATTLRVRRDPFDIDSLMSIVTAVNADVPVLESRVVDDYDAYYYSRDGGLPLPVLRVKFDDPDKTWFYIDPRVGQLVGSLHRLDRVERWLYNGLHSLDFSFWYARRPLWDVGVIVLCVGGLVVSGIGFYLGSGRVLRFLRRRGRLAERDHRQSDGQAF